MTIVPSQSLSACYEQTLAKKKKKEASQPVIALQLPVSLHPHFTDSFFYFSIENHFLMPAIHLFTSTVPRHLLFLLYFPLSEPLAKSWTLFLFLYTTGIMPPLMSFSDLNPAPLLSCQCGFFSIQMRVLWQDLGYMDLWALFNYTVVCVNEDK